VIKLCVCFLGTTRIEDTLVSAIYPRYFTKVAWVHYVRGKETNVPHYTFNTLLYSVMATTSMTISRRGASRWNSLVECRLSYIGVSAKKVSLIFDFDVIRFSQICSKIRFPFKCLRRAVRMVSQILKLNEEGTINKYRKVCMYVCIRETNCMWGKFYAVMVWLHACAINHIGTSRLRFVGYPYS